MSAPVPENVVTMQLQPLKFGIANTAAAAVVVCSSPFIWIGVEGKKKTELVGVRMLEIGFLKCIDISPPPGNMINGMNPKVTRFYVYVH